MHLDQGHSLAMKETEEDGNQTKHLLEWISEKTNEYVVPDNPKVYHKMHCVNHPTVLVGSHSRPLF